MGCFLYRNHFKNSLPMQRVSSISKRREENEDEFPKRIKEPELSFNNEIIFEMCKVYHRKPHMSKLKTLETRNHCSKLQQKSFSIDIPYVFDYTFSFYTNLKNITISNSRCVLLKAFSQMKLEKLEFNSVNNYEITDTKLHSLDHLIFRNCNINPKLFPKVLSFLNPRSLSFFNCKLKMNTENSEYKIYLSIQSLKLLNLENIESFITLPVFERLVHEMKLDKFFYKSSKQSLKSCLSNLSISYFIIQGISFSSISYLRDRMKFFEIISVDSTQNLTEILYLKHLQLKYLICNNINFSNDLISSLPSVYSIAMSNCSFENLSFYTFINKNSQSLRFISMKNVQLPLDGLSFLKKRLSNCLLEINTEARLYIP